MVAIALTGGTGLVGAALLPRLVEAGHTVRVLVRPRADRQLPNLPGITWIEGRLDEQDPLDQLVHDVDCVLHMAYLPPIDSPVAGRSMADHWVHTNLVGTTRLLERTVDTRGKQLIYVSSLAVYGRDPNQDPLGRRFRRDEDYPLWPLEFYGSMRAACEKLVFTASRAYQLNTSVFRLGNVIGLREPWQDSPLFETVDEAVRYGDLRTQVGTYAISVADTCRILMAALGDASLQGRVFNTFDRWFDHACLAPWLSELLGKPVGVSCAEAREPSAPIQGDRIRERYATFDTERAMRELCAELVSRCLQP